MFPFNGINYVSGLTNIRYRDYALATFIGMIPGTSVYVYLSATAVDVKNNPIALIISIYPVYFLVNLWFDNFAYTTNINYLNFGFGLVIVLGIVVFVSGINTLKVAVKNPIDTLSND